MATGLHRELRAGLGILGRDNGVDTGDGWSQCVVGDPACERIEPIGAGPILDDLARLVVER